jgi:hypothetical protein
VFGVPETSKEVIMAIFIDDGVETKIHRKMIMSPDFKVVGLQHCEWNTEVSHFTKSMTVIDYAKKFKANDNVVS